MLFARRPITSFASLATGTAALVALVGPSAPAAFAAQRHVGNGINKLPPSKAIADAAAALKDEANVTLSGTVHQSGGTVSISLRSTQRGRDVAGVMKSTTKAIGFVGTINLVKVASTSYVDGGKSFWQSALASAQLSPSEEAKVVVLLTNRWIELSGANASSFVGAFSEFSPAGIANSLDKAGATYQKLAPEIFDGVPVLPITDGKGSTVYLSMRGNPVPLKAVGARVVGNSATGGVVLHYPKSLSIVAPKGAETLQQIESAALK